jgi:hypothetical protein
MDSFYKQNSEQLDYDIDFTQWLPDGDAIVSTTVSCSPEGLTLAISDPQTAIPKVWVSGGVNKKRYVVSVLIETAQSRTKEVNFQIKIKDY